MKKYQHGFLPIVILFIIAGVIVGYFSYKYFHKTPTQIACTQEAKICPDGSSVGRTGPNCEFASCPMSTPITTTNWKTYTNTEKGFSVKYPVDWKVDETNRPRQYTLDSGDLKWNYTVIPTTMVDGAFISISFHPLQSGKTLKEEVSNILGKQAIITDALVSGEKGLSGYFNATKSDEINQYGLWTIKNNNIVSIQLIFPYNSTQASKFKEIFSNVLSTFKFTK